MHKQVIVVRKNYPDGKGGNFSLRRGKECSQAAHASSGWITNRLANYDTGKIILYSYAYLLLYFVFVFIDAKFDTGIGVLLGCFFPIFSMVVMLRWGWAYFDLEEIKWLKGSATKITLQVENLEELLKISEAAIKAGLTTHMVTDMGKTEFDGIPTQTALAIGPNEAEAIDKVTGHLKLY